MPTYEYECSKCNLVFDHFQSMSEDPLSTCVHPAGCKHKRTKAKVKRLLGTGAGIIFKGSGFYETDYRSSNYKESAKNDTETPKKDSKETPSTNGKGKTESKSSTHKTEAKSD